MSQPDTTSSVVTRDGQTDNERFKNIIDYGGDAPHIRLTTPDNFLFIVSASLLSSASPVFKAMIETCGTNNSAATLELTDKSLEPEEYVELLVNCMRGDFPGIGYCNQDLIELAKKYECLEVLAGLELQIYREYTNMRHHCDYSDALPVISLHAWPLLGKIICDMDDYRQDHSPTCCLQDITNPRTWSPKAVRQYNRNGADFVWAMTQAAFETYDYETKTYNYKRMGQIFSHLMAVSEYNTNYQPSEKKLRELASLSEGRDGNKRRKVDASGIAGL